MIALRQDLPDNVIGIVASGEVSANDYETVLAPAIESSLKKHRRLRILYQLGPTFTGFTVGAMWDDMKVGLGHLGAWDKIAVVTDVTWIAGATRAFGFTIPCPVKVLSNSELTQAERWIQAD
ncbi:STAS/SEC14 domain-containing protein [Rhodoferax sp.]|uniref:STAS/SEC14 domain-containing protein n=1 Tax=Rhodoferax sp. TaxID=50421 RepID=UPI0028419A63|nr:STAS/SEC14 domain-containing protein [Rhodoferax sp.]MDR3369540.1 STAS/SEC14 domain-containing protein [Rhodoferax sp.]